VNVWVVDANAKVTTFACEIELKDKKFSCTSIILMFPLQDPSNKLNLLSFPPVTVRRTFWVRDGLLKWMIPGLDESNPKAELEYAEL
jgi:hypothetical protein